MPIVVDASIVLASMLGEVQPAATFASTELEQNGWIVPALWWFEVCNGLIVNERRGRITEQLSASFLHELSRMPTTVDNAANGDNLMVLARKHRLTVYDTAYLELAARTGLPLATLDAALAKAAQAEQVPVIGTAG